MARHTQTYDLQDELDAIDADLDAIAEDQVGLEARLEEDPEDAAAAAEYRSNNRRANELESAFVGLQWALDPDDDREPITEVALGSLSAGERATVGDRVGTLAAQKQRSGWGQNPQLNEARNIEFAAACVQEASFIDSEDHVDKVAAVSDLAPQFVDWIELRGDELTTPDVSGNSFATRVAEKR